LLKIINCMKKQKFLFIFCAMLSFASTAQLATEKRIEIELRKGYSYEKIYHSSEGFFVMASTADKEVDGQIEEKYDFYNSDLELIKTETILVPEGLNYDLSYSNDESLFILYNNWKKGELFISEIQINMQEVSGTKVAIEPKASIDNMIVLGDQAYLYMFTKEGHELYNIDLESGTGTEIPFHFGSRTSKSLDLFYFQVLERTKEIFFIEYVYNENGSYETYIISITKNNTINDPVKISENFENGLLSVTPYRIDEETMILTGTYSKMNQYSQGIYFCQVTNGFIDYIHYYNFLDLKDFIPYLPEQAQKEIERKQKTAEKNDKELLLNYSMVNHDIIILDDGYLFLGEACYPTYKEIIYENSSQIVFDGYDYTHAVLCKFSKTGEIMWNTCFEMDPAYKLHVPKCLIAVTEQTNSQISMVYASGNDLISKTVDYDGEIVNEEKKTFFESGDSKTKNTFSHLEHWYGSSFLAYGSQEIKDGNKKRKVYFINKIEF